VEIPWDFKPFGRTPLKSAFHFREKVFAGLKFCFREKTIAGTWILVDSGWPS